MGFDLGLGLVDVFGGFGGAAAADVGAGLGADAALTGGLDAAAFSAAPLAETAAPLAGGLGGDAALFAPEASAFAAPLDTSLLGGAGALGGAGFGGTGFGGAGIGSDLIGLGGGSSLAGDAGISSIPGLASASPVGLSQAGAADTLVAGAGPASTLQPVMPASQALESASSGGADLPGIMNDSAFQPATFDPSPTPSQTIQDMVNLDTGGPLSGGTGSGSAAGLSGADSGLSGGASSSGLSGTPVSTVSGGGAPPASGTLSTGSFSSPSSAAAGGGAGNVAPAAKAAGGIGGSGVGWKDAAFLGLAGAPLAATLFKGESPLPPQAGQLSALSQPLSNFATAELSAAQNNQVMPGQQAQLNSDRQTALNQWRQALYNQGVQNPESDSRWSQIVSMVDQQIAQEQQGMITANIQSALAAAGGASANLTNLANMQVQQDTAFTNALAEASRSLGTVGALTALNSGRGS